MADNRRLLKTNNDAAHDLARALGYPVPGATITSPESHKFETDGNRSKRNDLTKKLREFWEDK
jgi:hypothetical protein